MRSTSRTISTIAAAAALVAAATAGPASALPNNGGGNGQDPPPHNTLPVASFTVSPNPALVGEVSLTQAQARFVPSGPVTHVGQGDLVTFDGSASHDADGSVKKYEWDLDGNGSFETTTTTPKTSRRYLTPGTIQVHLRVVDDKAGQSGIATKALVLHRAPHAVLKANTLSPLVGETVQFSPAGSTGDPSLAKYEFDLDDNGTFEDASSTATIDKASFGSVGPHTVGLRVTDAYGVTSTSSVTVQVHRAPAAAFTVSAVPTAGSPVSFDASGSTDEGDPTRSLSGTDATITRYEWDLDGDGTFETDTKADPHATTTFAAAGTTTVRLRVTDGQGFQDIVSHAVTVAAPPTGTTTTTGAGSTADTVAPKLRVLTSSAKMARTGRVAIRVSCPAGESRCDGLLGVNRGAGGPSASFGTAKFRLAGGQAVTLKVTLNRAGRKLVRKHRSTRLLVTATATDAAKNTATVQHHLRVRR